MVVFEARFVHFLSQPWSRQFSRALVSFSGKWYFKTTVWVLGMLIAGLVIVSETISVDGTRKYLLKEKIPHVSHLLYTTLYSQ